MAVFLKSICCRIISSVPCSLDVSIKIVYFPCGTYSPLSSFPSHLMVYLPGLRVAPVTEAKLSLFALKLPPFMRYQFFKSGIPTPHNPTAALTIFPLHPAAFSFFPYNQSPGLWLFFQCRNIYFQDGQNTSRTRKMPDT